MAANQQRKSAIRRLMSDLEEIRNSPVTNVSAAPLDDNMFEWHCNFNYDGTIFHLLLFFPENYPYKSPSAEFMPPGYIFPGGATKQGQKGTQVCLSIFSDFEDIHTEWADEKSTGWSPGYTVQTVLLNLVAFLAEYQSTYTQQSNGRLARSFSCRDCGHTHQKPFPPFDDKPTKVINSGFTDSISTETHTVQIIDYMSKAHFSGRKPATKEELFGYGLVKGGTRNKPTLSTPCEFLTAGSFYSMCKSVGKAQSIMKEDLEYFLPLYITPIHGQNIKETFEATMKEVACLLPDCDMHTSIEDLVLKTIPNLMVTTVVEFSKGQQHTSDNHLSGYFALHRLFLWATSVYPSLQQMVDDRLQEFISSPEKRLKKCCPNLGEWLVFLGGSAKFRWKDVSSAYLGECWRRNVMWYVKDDAKLADFQTDQSYRLEKTLTATAVSRKLLAFQVLFLDIAIPTDLTRDEIVARYDSNYGFPTEPMVSEMKAACQRIAEMKTYNDWFKIIKVAAPSEAELFQNLVDSVKFAMETEGYHFTPQGGRGDSAWGRGGYHQGGAAYRGNYRDNYRDGRQGGYGGNHRDNYGGGRHGGAYGGNYRDDYRDDRQGNHHRNNRWQNWRRPQDPYGRNSRYNERY